MKLSQYLKKERGRLFALARDIKSHTSSVSLWASNQRPVPIERCVEIERATNGEVTRKDLRPDDWRRIWPELEAKEVEQEAVP